MDGMEIRLNTMEANLPEKPSDSSMQKIQNEYYDALDEYKAVQDEYNELEQQLSKLENQDIPRGPFVQDTDKWTALAIKRLLRVAVEEGYDSIAFSPGDIHKARWNEPGLIEFYDSKIPSVTKNVINKNLKIKDYKYTIATLKDVEDVKFTALTEDIGQERFIITITPEIREKVMKGISLFSVGAIATEGMLEEKEPVNGY